MLTRITRREGGLALALVFLLGAVVGLVRGIAYADGQPDTSFSTDGRLNEDIALKRDVAQAVVIQPDGKILVAGQAQRSTPRDYDVVLARYNPNGNRDTTFGDGGIVLQGLREGEDSITAMALQPDGKIVVAGYAGFTAGLHFGVGRYNANGTPDTAFGTDHALGWYFHCEAGGGLCNDNFSAIANSVAIQPDGKILAAGRIGESGASLDFFVMRLNANGTRDTSFGTGGKVRTDFFGGPDEAHAIAIQPDGKIVVVGRAHLSGNDSGFALVRYGANGQVDRTFGNQGQATVHFLFGDDVAYGVALQPDGKIVVVGRFRNGPDYDFGIVRFQTNGGRDPSFNGDQLLLRPFTNTGTADFARAVIVQPDGKILAIGEVNDPTDPTGTNFAVVRVTSDGSLDKSLNGAGTLTLDFGAGGEDAAYGAALQADGNLVVVGSALVRTRNASDLAIARFVTNVFPPPTPTATPKPTRPPVVTPTPPVDSRFFAETGQTVRGLFLQYWETHGGLAQQGFPITEEIQEKSDTDGKTYTMQYFERAVFEHHPENQPPFNVLLSLLGTFFYNDKYGGNAPNQRPSIVNPLKFAETGKTLGGTFRKYWETHGGLAQQGFPISDEFQEVSDTDGKTYTVQYFQRAVVELHPEFAGTPNEVLLSLRGVFFDKKKHNNVGP